MDRAEEETKPSSKAGVDEPFSVTFFFFFFFNNLQPMLANVGEGLIFLFLDPGIKFPIKLSCYLCKKKRNNSEVKKRREKGQKEGK